MGKQWLTIFLATAGSLASGALELPVLGADIEFGVAMRGSWGLAEMPVHLSALARTGEEDSATALGGVQGQLVKGLLLFCTCVIAVFLPSSCRDGMDGRHGDNSGSSFFPLRCSLLLSKWARAKKIFENHWLRC